MPVRLPHCTVPLSPRPQCPLGKEVTLRGHPTGAVPSRLPEAGRLRELALLHGRLVSSPLFPVYLVVPLHRRGWVGSDFPRRVTMHPVCISSVSSSQLWPRGALSVATPPRHSDHAPRYGATPPRHGGHAPSRGEVTWCSLFAAPARGGSRGVFPAHLWGRQFPKAAAGSFCWKVAFRSPGRLSMRGVSETP